MTAGQRLDQIGRERFSEAVESSFSVSVRPQFFVWTQASLQSLLPHEILICGIVDGSRDGMVMHRFSASRYFRQEQFDVVSDPITGLLPKLLAASGVSGRPVVMSPVVSPTPADDALHSLVSGNEMKDLLAHLVQGTRGKVEAFYVLSRTGMTLDSHAAYLMELLVPHIHSAFLRVLANERQAATSDTRRAGRLITPRQEEILNLIKTGKTNSEIAVVLDCSPWTIKNHIQAILRKLNTNSRTHAIARAMSLGILKTD